MARPNRTSTPNATVEPAPEPKDWRVTFTHVSTKGALRSASIVVEGATHKEALEAAKHITERALYQKVRFVRCEPY